MLDLSLQVGEIDEMLVEPRHVRSWWGLRDDVDAETALFIAVQLTHAGRASPAALDGLHDPAVARAIEACRDALASWAGLGKARERTRVKGNAGIAWFGGQVEALTQRTVELVERAQTLVEQALGIERAVGFARRGEKWVPRDRHQELRLLLEEEEAAQRAKAEPDAPSPR
jgi:hypothetical protein